MRKSSSGSEQEECKSGSKSDDDIFAKIDELHPDSFKKPTEKPWIIVDGSNVAMRHGKN